VCDAQVSLRSTGQNRCAQVHALAGYLTTGNEDGKPRNDVKRRIYGDNPMRTYLLRGTILGSGEA